MECISKDRVKREKEDKYTLYRSRNLTVGKHIINIYGHTTHFLNTSNRKKKPKNNYFERVVYISSTDLYDANSICFVNFLNIQDRAPESWIEQQENNIVVNKLIPKKKTMHRTRECISKTRKEFRSNERF